MTFNQMFTSTAYVIHHWNPVFILIYSSFGPIRLLLYNNVEYNDLKKYAILLDLCEIYLSIYFLGSICFILQCLLNTLNYWAYSRSAWAFPKLLNFKNYNQISTIGFVLNLCYIHYLLCIIFTWLVSVIFSYHIIIII